MKTETAETDEEIVEETLEVAEPEQELEDEAEEETEAASEEGEVSEVEAEDDDDVFVSIDGEAPSPEEEEDVPPQKWVHQLRKQYREEKRRVIDLEQKLKALEGGQAPVHQPLGNKPTLEDADYDTERYETELAAWYEKKRSHDERQAQVQAEQQAVQKDWERKLESYHSSKSDLKVKDYEFAEDVVQDTLSVMQQGMIVQGADNPALVVYALGKNPKKAKEIASITDPVKFAFAVAKLETNLKVTKRKAQAKPEKKISGTGRPSGSVDNTLERLRAEAERTGDYSKVFSYKRQKQSA